MIGRKAVVVPRQPNASPLDPSAVGQESGSRATQGEEPFHPTPGEPNTAGLVQSATSQPPQRRGEASRNRTYRQKRVFNQTRSTYSSHENVELRVKLGTGHDLYLREG